MRKNNKLHTYEKLKNLLTLALFISTFTMLILYRDTVNKSIYNSVNYCLSYLYPSLFPFIFTSTLFSLSVPENILNKVFSPFMKKLFKLQGSCFLAFIFALLFGYPLGAKLTSALCKENKISENEAFRLFSCCLSPGLPFCVLFVGSKLLGSMNLGIIIFITIILCNLFVLYLSSIFAKIPSDTNSVNVKINIYEKISTSLNSSAKALLNMALYVLIFRAVSDLLFASGTFTKINNLLFFLPSNIKAFIGCFLLEVTGGAAEAININLSLPYIGAGLSFGGLSIFFQLFSFFKVHSFKLSKLIIIRIFSSFLTFLCLKLYCFFNPEIYTLTVSGSISEINKPYMQNTFLSTILFTLLLLFMVLLFDKKQNDKNYGNS